MSPGVVDRFEYCVITAGWSGSIESHIRFLPNRKKIHYISLEGSGPLLCMECTSPLFYSFYLHTYTRYTLWYFCIFLQFTLPCTDMKWVTLALNPPHNLNNSCCVWWRRTANIGGSGPLLYMAGMSPLFYSFYLHTYTLWCICIFLQFTVLCINMKWVILALNCPHILNNHISCGV